MKRKYHDSAEAYNAIHAALTYEIDACLEDREYNNAIIVAELMREIEGHTDIINGDE